MFKFRDLRIKHRYFLFNFNRDSLCLFCCFFVFMYGKYTTSNYEYSSNSPTYGTC